MSIHICKCIHKGKEEYHLRYPGMTESEAQTLADRINGGGLSPAPQINNEAHCPVCGYYCLGNGGVGCIDKPSMTPN